MLNVTAQIFGDYFISRSFSLSAEISYYGMAKIDLAEGGRDNRIFEFKAGLSYFYPQSK